jgi:hypothetical protein
VSWTKCHEKKTQDRIRGVKGSKVLRTRKIAETQIGTRIMSGPIFVVKVVGMILCMNIGTEFILLHPRTECLETPITDPVKTKTRTDYFGNPYKQKAKG